MEKIKELIVPSNTQYYFDENQNILFVENSERIYKVSGENLEEIYSIIKQLNHKPLKTILRNYPNEIKERFQNEILRLQNYGLLKKKEKYNIQLFCSESIKYIVTRFLINELGDIANICSLDNLNELNKSNIDLVVLVTSNSQSSMNFELNNYCVSNKIHVLFSGFDFDNTAFIGPYWEPNKYNACYQCFQNRINMNSLFGQTRKELEMYIKNNNLNGLCKVNDFDLFKEFLIELSATIKNIIGNDDDFNDQTIWFKKENGNIQANTHPLLPVPFCEACHSYQSTYDNPVTHKNELMKSVDSIQGIVHMVSEIPNDEKNPNIYVSGSKSSNLRLYHPSLKIVTNAGAGYSRKEANVSAVGESLERYAAGIYNKSDFILSSWNDLKYEAVHPKEFALFSDKQYKEKGFPYVPFEEETIIRWVKALELGGEGKEKWIPAASVYLPYRYNKDESKIMPSISTGLAAGPTLEQAILVGLYEVIERDAFTVSWINRIPPRKMNIDLPDYIAETFFKENIEYYIYDLTLDIQIPVSFVVLRNKNYSKEIINVGGACRSNQIQSIEKAIMEAAQGCTYVYELLELYKDWKVTEDFYNVDSFQKHALFYSKYPNLIEKVNYLLNGATSFRESLDTIEQFSNIKSELEWTINMIRNQGYIPYYIDLTTPDLRKIGVSVVRVVVPGLQHLHGHHRYSFLGGKRLESVPERLKLNIKDKNIYPHPYP